MNVGIIDADLIGRAKHRFPNLVSLKLSDYYKSLGDTVSLLLNYDNLKNYDKIFISKVFSDTNIPDGIIGLPNVEYGGTGFFYDKAPPLPDIIEHSKPDYHLYDGWVADRLNSGTKPKDLAYYTDYSIGYTTRRCIKGCSYCVNKNYKECILGSPLNEFLDESRSYVCLLDDNVLAYKGWREIFKDLQSSGKKFQFKQGMDERLLTDEKCETIFKSNWVGDYIFAFDNIKDKDIIENKLKLIRKYTNVVPKFYLFCGYNHDIPDHYTDEFWKHDIEDMFKRIEILMKYKCLPYIMRYKDYEVSPYRGTYVNISRWCNQPSFFKKKSYREFCIANGLNSACYKYLVEFETENPDIAKRHYDIKYENQ